MSRSSHPPNVAVPEGSLPIAFGDVLDGKYRVDQLLGMGGMAVVLAGTHIELDAPIAIKVLLPARAGNRDAVRRFLTEARAAAKLKSPNVARITDVGTAPTASGVTLPFIVMERLDGVDLATLLEHRKKLPVDEAVDFMRQACRGLEEAHSQGIVHRDIKPANLFLTRTREGAPLVKVLDFGISKTIASFDTQHLRAVTADQEVMGSPGYMSPEQVRAPKDVDVRTDIWSLGVVLYELISGREAFAGDALPDIFASILHGEPTPLEEDIPAEVRAIVRRCLQKDVGRRYQSAAELTRALSEAVDRPDGVPTRALSNRGPLVAAAVATVIVIGGAGLFAHSQREQEALSPPAMLSLENAVTVPPPPAQAPAPPTPIIIAAPPPTDPTPAAEPARARPSTPKPALSAPPAPPPIVSATHSPPQATRKRTDW